MIVVIFQGQYSDTHILELRNIPKEDFRILEKS